MPTLVSKAEYARLHNRSPQAIGKWERKSALVFIDGKVNVEASDQRMAALCLGRYMIRSSTPSTGVNHQPQPATRPTPVDALDDAPRGPSGEIDLDAPETTRTLDLFVERLLGGSYADLGEAATVKENALALKHVLAARREAGLVVEVEVASQVLFEEARAARDAWLNFPGRVGALLAAEVGVDADKLIEALTAHVHRQLEDIGEPDPDFAAADLAPA